MKKNFFALRVGGRALGKATQGDHGVSLSEDIENPLDSFLCHLL